MMAEVQFDEATHTYSVDGQVLPSVTQIIRFLNYDVAENAKSWLRDVAADRGRRVHEYCMLYDFGELPDEIDFDCKGFVKAYKAFIRDYAPIWRMVETPLGSVEIGFAGTPDRYGAINSIGCIVDIKTGTKINDVAVAAQLTGYDWLIADTEDLKHYGLHLRKDGTYKLTEYGLGPFTTCLEIHHALEKGKTHG